MGASALEVLTQLYEADMGNSLPEVDGGARALDVGTRAPCPVGALVSRDERIRR